MLEKLKRRTYELLVDPPPGDLVANGVSLFIMLLIAVNVCISIAETEPALSAAHPEFFYNFELFSVIVFTIEYVGRLWACTLDPQYSRPFKGRLKLALTPMAIVDFLAIAPFYLQVFVKGLDLRFVRALRLFRLFRIFKFGRYTESLGLLKSVVTRRREELVMSVVVFTVMIVLVASVMYLFEHEAQPEAFRSVPVAMWWAIITVTTVGYGDVSPITSTGQVFGGIIAFLGICVFALPVGILGSSFIEEINERKEKKRLTAQGYTEEQIAKILEGEDVDQPGQRAVRCPHCHKLIRGVQKKTNDHDHAEAAMPAAAVVAGNDETVDDASPP